MEVRSKFSDRYKKDLSVDNLRAKVSRRKSITQKENRQAAFKKSRGQSLTDVINEQEQTVVEEVNESCHVRGHENKPANQERTKGQLVKEERQALLQRYKEEKQLRKLKEQRENAQKKIFKCGIYRPEKTLIPVFTAQTGAKEKPPAPCATRVTRSAAKMAPADHRTRAQANPVNVTSKASEGAIPKVRGQTSVVKKNEKESKVSIPSTRTTRSTANAPSKITPAGKAPPKSAPAIKPQKKTTKETSPETVLDKSELPVVECTSEKVKELEPILEESCVENEPETLPVGHERLPSFAPENFVFQPLDGLSTFQFQPMTPNRANAFLTPNFTWSSQGSGRNFVISKEDIAQAMDITEEMDPVFPPELSPIAAEVKQNVNASPKNNECTSDVSSAPQTSPPLTPPPCEPSTEKSIPAHDVPYFRDILKSEVQKLSLLCNDWNKRIEIDIPEDAKDLIRTTVGQTKLLMTERFKQFEGLVDNCEFKRGEKETTCTDLDGFWDMVYFQIEDVSKKFVNLGKLEENSWQQDTVQTRKTVRKKIAPAATGKPNQGDTGRAAARSRLAAIKAAMKNKVKTEDPISEVEAPVIPMQGDPIVFDAGFFRIESPAKLPGSLRKNRRSLLPTPKSAKKIGQISGTPITSCVEGAAEEMKPAKSPSPPRRKALFGDPEEESLQNQEADLVVPTLENVEADSVPAVVDMNKYLVPSHTVQLESVESPGLLQSVGLETTQDDCYLETDVSSDVFMCSPARDVHAQAASLPETSEPDDEMKTTSEPLDFLGSCTPMVQHSPMTLDFDAPTDLMTFSPMEK